MQKTCTKCKILKEFNEFSLDPSHKDGKRSSCKICDSQYYTKNKERILSANKKWAHNNPEKIRNYSDIFELNNPGKRNLTKLQWQKDNPGKANANTRRRQASKLNATPKWLTKEHLQEIQEFYILAKELSWLSESPLEVDHIIPLQGKNLCGLHVPWNLQILPKKINCSKGNRV